MATKKNTPSQVVVGGRTISVPASTTKPKKKTTPKEDAASIQKMLADLDKQAKGALASVAPAKPAVAPVPPAIALALGIPQTGTEASPGGKITQQAAQVDAAVEGARNAIQGFAAATGSGLPQDFRPNQPGSTQTTQEISADRRDAFALLRDTFASYGIDSLAGIIEGYMKSDMGPYEASLKLKNEQVYKDRFKGNELRRAAGLNVLSEAEYLNQENTYQEVFRAYNQTSLLGADKQSQRDYMANLMARDLSPYEIRQRFDVATTRVANADPSVKKQLQAYYGLSDNQMVSFVIAPDQTLADIQQKISTAEIGSAATQAGFGGQVSKQRAEELAKFGVDLEEARQGYQAIAGGLTQGQKIAQRYGGQYDMTTAEEELFKGNQQAAAKRKRFASLERAAFGGQSGITSGSLGKKGSGAF